MSATIERLYNQVVESAEITCHACPTQYEGVLVGGLRFYFRYRYGYATLGIGKDEDEAVRNTVAGTSHGDTYDGVLTHEEYQALFVELYAAGVGA